MKDLLLLIRDDAGQAARLQAAIKVARLLGGEITCLEVDERGAMNDEIASASVDGRVLRDLVCTQALANRERVERDLQRAGVAWTWTTGRDGMANALCAEAAFHDLTVMNAQPRSYSWLDSSFLVSVVARAAHQPLLLVPEEEDQIDFTRHALVAWDGSRPCIAALRAATPLLAHVEVVTLVEIGAHGTGATLERGATYLARHGIHAHIERADLFSTPAEWLLGRCERIADTWCVMGAFGHSRLRESIFGGVTMDMLNAATTPLLVAH